MNPSLSPVHAFLRQPSMVDFSGHIAAIFFVSGCNFRCGFCHNASLFGDRRDGLSWQRLREVCRAFGDQWVDAAVITGGEPALSPRLPELIALFREAGWRVKLDTNGSVPESLGRCLPDLDYVALDVKCALADYPRLTGFRDVGRIIESIRTLRERARDYELRTTVIEAVHTLDHMSRLKEVLRGTRRYVLQPFVPRDDLPDPTFRAMPRTSLQHLQAIARLVDGWADELVVRGA